MITTRQIENIPSGNPFLSDAFHMGTYLGKNVCVMYPNHPSEKMNYLIVVNTETGERVRLEFR